MLLLVLVTNVTNVMKVSNFLKRENLCDIIYESSGSMIIKSKGLYSSSLTEFETKLIMEWGN